MLLRLPYLALSSVLTLMRLLPMSDTDKDIEILTLRPCLPSDRGHLFGSSIQERQATHMTNDELRAGRIQFATSETGMKIAIS